MDDRAAAQPARPADTTCCARHRFGTSATSRRTLVASAVGVPLLAACGTSGDSGAESGGAGDAGGDAGGTAEGIAKSDIPVGGGAIFDEAQVVVTQPTEGDFRAFTAVCTHQQCLVTQVTEEGIDCSCHGSVFSLDDGSVLDGPAEEPLAAKTVTDEGETLTIA